MSWLERHAWWGLLFMTLTLVVFGITDVISGLRADPAIPQGLTGLTLAELERESVTGYRVADFYSRINGYGLIPIGVFATAILLFAFRRDQHWAWWAMWTLPLWAAGGFVFYLVAGIAPGQAPPPPMVSGPIFAVLGAAILLVSAPRFFRQ